MNRVARIAFALIFLQFSNSVLSSESIHLISVTDYQFTLNNKPAVSIYLGESETKACSITIEKENLYQGYVAKSFKRNNQTIDAECMWGGSDFVRSSKHKTALEIKISSIDKKAEKAKVTISLNLIAPSTGKKVTFDEVSISIEGANFQNLISK